jgi:hypothetical protein
MFYKQASQVFQPKEQMQTDPYQDKGFSPNHFTCFLRGKKFYGLCLSTFLPPTYNFCSSKQKLLKQGLKSMPQELALTQLMNLFINKVKMTTAEYIQMEV